ncbi:MAG: hypothetical protein J3Q66DRAFT_321755, partial [Benniella sp.]
MRMPAEAFLLCLLLPPPPPPSKTRPTYTAAVISAQRQPRRPSDRRGGEGRPRGWLPPTLGQSQTTLRGKRDVLSATGIALHQLRF